MVGSRFQDEIGRVAYEVETDEGRRTYEFGVYAEGAKERSMEGLREKYGRDHVWWKANYDLRLRNSEMD